MSHEELEDARGILNTIREMLGYDPLVYPQKEGVAERLKERRKQKQQIKHGGHDRRTDRSERMKHRGPWHDRTAKGAL
jgi:hypothetical protein